MERVMELEIEPFVVWLGSGTLKIFTGQRFEFPSSKKFTVLKQFVQYLVTCPVKLPPMSVRQNAPKTTSNMLFFRPQICYCGQGSHIPTAWPYVTLLKTWHFWIGSKLLLFRRTAGSRNAYSEFRKYFNYLLSTQSCPMWCRTNW